MTDVSINGVPHTPVVGKSVDDISAERLRTIVQDSHLIPYYPRNSNCHLEALENSVISKYNKVPK